MREQLCREGPYAVLFEAAADQAKYYSAVFKNTLRGYCKFVIIAGPNVEECKEFLLDYLAGDENIVIPFFDYDGLDEAVEAFLFHDLPIDEPYECIFISLSDGSAALESGRSIFDAALKGDPL
jgi:hypothetical protein